MTSGRPVISTTTSGLPLAASRSTNSCCPSGKPRCARECASPLRPAGSPTTATTTSAAAASTSGVDTERPTSQNLIEILRGANDRCFVIDAHTDTVPEGRPDQR